MKKIMALLVVIGMASVAMGVPIPLVNADFQAGTTGADVPGWTEGTGTTLERLSTTQSGLTGNNLVCNIQARNGNYLEQSFLAAATAGDNDSYTVSFDVGWRNNGPVPSNLSLVFSLRNLTTGSDISSETYTLPQAASASNVFRLIGTQSLSLADTSQAVVAGDEIGLRMTVSTSHNSYDPTGWVDNLTVTPSGPTPASWKITPMSASVIGIVGVAYADTLVGKAEGSVPITYSLAASTPDWLGVASDGSISNTRALVVGDIGTNSFNVVCANGLGSDTGVLNIVVRGTLSPVWDPIGDQLVVTGANTNYVGTLAGRATDPEGETISYSLDTGPAWLEVATNGVMSTTATLGSGDVGTHAVTVLADDGVDAPTSSAPFDIIVFETVVGVEGTSEAISVNFVFDDGANQQMDPATLAGLSGYVYDSWIMTTGSDRGTNSNLKSSSDSTTAELIWEGADWTDNRSPYVDPAANGGIGDAQVAKGYLLDSPASFTVTSVPYANYTVVLYHASNQANEDVSFGTYTVNGIGKEPTGGATHHYLAPVNWDDTNTTVFEGVSGSTLTVLGPPNENPVRGYIAGFQIINEGYTPGAQVTDLVITGPVAGSIELSWTGENNKSYGVETNANLILSGGWAQDGADHIGSDAIITVTNAIGTDELFYRVRSK